MKQHISKSQLNELSPVIKGKLIVYCNDHKIKWRLFDDDVMTKPLLSIGQMIEFLEDNGNSWWRIEKHEVNVFVGDIPDGYEGHYTWNTDKGKNTLCDALWVAVKEVLNTNAPNGLDGSQGA
jgi:hypothetical protein